MPGLRRHPSLTGLRAALAACGLALTLAACATGPSGAPGVGVRPGTVTPPPAVLPNAPGADDELLGGATFSIDDPNADHGDGILLFAGGRPADLPLFDGPGGAHWGWYTQGRGYDKTRSRATAPRPDAVLRTPDGSGLVVLTAQRDGWLEVRWGRPDDFRRGRGWTRADLARSGRVVLDRWSDQYALGSALVYRNQDVAYNLRAGPGTDNRVIEPLSGDGYDMTALEMRGDWLRVRATFPPSCGGAGGGSDDVLLGGAPTRDVTGWIRWRSNAKGPWIERASRSWCAAAS